MSTICARKPRALSGRVLRHCGTAALDPQGGAGGREGTVDATEAECT